MSKCNIKVDMAPPIDDITRNKLINDAKDDSILKYKTKVLAISQITYLYKIKN